MKTFPKMNVVQKGKARKYCKAVLLHAVETETMTETRIFLMAQVSVS